MRNKPCGSTSTSDCYPLSSVLKKTVNQSRLFCGMAKGMCTSRGGQLPMQTLENPRCHLVRLPVASAHCIISGFAYGAKPLARSCPRRRLSSTPPRALSLSHLLVLQSERRRSLCGTRVNHLSLLRQIAWRYSNPPTSVGGGSNSKLCRH